MRTRTMIAALASAIAALMLATSANAGGLSDDLKNGLATSKYVYISSTRKDGKLGEAAEIWFLYYDGAVYVASPPTTHRVRRIKAGRPQAKLYVCKTAPVLGGNKTQPDCPAISAIGMVVNDPKVQQLMLETYAKKYPDGWPKFEQKFRTGFKDGSRVLIKYTPKEREQS